jgi:hypothetical protein
MIWLMAAMASPPAGWAFAERKHYAVKTVAGGPDGQQYAEIRGKSSADAFAALTQSVDAKTWRGHRVQLSVFLKVDAVEDWAGAWMRVDGQEKLLLAFDNMQNRALRGTQDWQRYTVVLDVPETAESILYGALLSGPGTLGVDGVTLTRVASDVPVTDLRLKERKPKNLSFDL